MCWLACRIRMCGWSSSCFRGCAPVCFPAEIASAPLSRPAKSPWRRAGDDAPGIGAGALAEKALHSMQRSPCALVISFRFGIGVAFYFGCTLYPFNVNSPILVAGSSQLELRETSDLCSSDGRAGC